MTYSIYATIINESTNTQTQGKYMVSTWQAHGGTQYYYLKSTVCLHGEIS